MVKFLKLQELNSPMICISAPLLHTNKVSVNDRNKMNNIDNLYHLISKVGAYILSYFGTCKLGLISVILLLGTSCLKFTPAKSDQVSNKKTTSPNFSHHPISLNRKTILKTAIANLGSRHQIRSIFT